MEQPATVNEGDRVESPKDSPLGFTDLFSCRPFYSDERCAIFHGDAKDIMPMFTAVDLIVTDPPYGVGKAAWDVEFCDWWFDEAARVAPAVGLMPGVENIGRCPHDIRHLRFRWCLAARINNGMTRSKVGFGNWIPCLVYTADGVKLHGNHQDCREFSIRGVKNGHPSPKPEGVMKWFCDVLPGQTVLDPFMGSGTTLVGAKLCGKFAVGIDREERYCEMAANRLRQRVLF